MSEEKSQQAIDIKLWAHEAGRYKGKCVRLQKEIDRLREEIEIHKLTCRMQLALLDVIVETLGEVTISKDALDAAAKDGRDRTVPEYDEQTQTYTLRPLKVEQESETE